MKLYPVFDTTYVTMYHALDIIVILSTNWGLKSNPPTGVKQIACCEFGVAVLNQEGQVYQQIHGNNGPRLKKNFVLLDAFISDDVTVKKIVAHPEGTIITTVSELCNSTELDLFFSFKIKTLSNLFSSLSNYLISSPLSVIIRSLLFSQYSIISPQASTSWPSPRKASCTVGALVTAGCWVTKTTVIVKHPPESTPSVLIRSESS